MEKCGCGVRVKADTCLIDYDIIFCPLHRAAGEMLEALEALEEVSQRLSWVCHLASVPERREEYLGEAELADIANDKAVDMRRAAILKAKGE